jgi:hypothetical protein
MLSVSKLNSHLTNLELVNLVGKSEGKRPFGRPKQRREDNIRMDLREM